MMIFFSKEYKVYLANGTKVEFDGDGSWKEIDGNRNTIPTGFVSAKITNYVKEVFQILRLLRLKKIIIR